MDNTHWIFSHWIITILYFMNTLRCNGYCIAMDIALHWILYCNGYCIEMDIILQWILHCNGCFIATVIALRCILYCNGYCIVNGYFINTLRKHLWAPPASASPSMISSEQKNYIFYIFKKRKLPRMQVSRIFRIATWWRKLKWKLNFSANRLQVGAENRLDSKMTNVFLPFHVFF